MSRRWLAAALVSAAVIASAAACTGGGGNAAAEFPARCTQEVDGKKREIWSLGLRSPGIVVTHDNGVVSTASVERLACERPLPQVGRLPLFRLPATCAVPEGEAPLLALNPRDGDSRITTPLRPGSDVEVHGAAGDQSFVVLTDAHDVGYVDRTRLGCGAGETAKMLTPSCVADDGLAARLRVKLGSQVEVGISLRQLDVRVRAPSGGPVDVSVTAVHTCDGPRTMTVEPSSRYVPLQPGVGALDKPLEMNVIGRVEITSGELTQVATWAWAPGTHLMVLDK